MKVLLDESTPRRLASSFPGSRPLSVRCVDRFDPSRPRVREGPSASRGIAANRATGTVADKREVGSSNLPRLIELTGFRGSDSRYLLPL